MPLDLDALARDVIRPVFAASGLEWKGYYGGRRGAETEMNRYTNGNSQITSHHFGHTKAVADAHYIKPIPEETKIAGPRTRLDASGDYRETSGSGRIECKLMPVNRLEGCVSWLKRAVLKTAIPERVSGVRIPLPPPFSQAC